MKSSPEAKQTFEEALEELEALVAGMESGSIPLDELVRQFARGNELLTACAARLHDAERKIQLLQKERKTLSFENFDPDKS